jgi:yjeF C-terminal region, hydroxyethylthiazole kinase-related/yjeF N-terminal region
VSEPVLSPAGVKALDARLEKAGLLELAMEEAGRAVAAAAQECCPAGRVLLLAGGGANGGDALVAARHLFALGRDVAVLALPAKHPLTRSNRRRLARIGVEVAPLTPASLRRELKTAALVVDGLLGTGFTPPLRAPLAELVAQVNASGVPTLAIDLPTGLDALTSEVSGDPLRAAWTVTLSGLKPALLFGPAAYLAGEVTLADLRSPPDWALEEALASRPTDAEIAALLPVRHADAHKGTAGRVWVVGGHPGTVGAAALAGVAALRAGSGLVTIHSATDVPLVMPELMMRCHADLSAALMEMPEEQRPDALCVGMGLGPDAASIARQLLGWRLPTVLDADALQPELAGAGHDACIWTPHPGEAARLLGTSTPDIARDPIAAARALQEKFGGVVVVKGGPSVIAHTGGVWVSRGGHPGMASAGMGDTLSGLLASLLGQGLSAPDAALAGVTLHARAGELAGAKHGYGLTATDVSAELGRAWLGLVGG